jgi:hypothetical protein
MFTRQWLSVLAVACLGLAGCDDSTVPLGNPQKATGDVHLAGLWRLNDPHGNVTYYHVGPAGGKLPDAVFRVVSVSRTKDGHLAKPGEFLAFTTHLSSGDYLNLVLGQDANKFLEQQGWKPHVAASYILCKYTLDRDTLLVRVMEPAAKKRAIEGGSIKGLVTKQSGGGESIRFTDTTENLARLVAAEGDHLFAKQAMKLERVK